MKLILENFRKFVNEGDDKVSKKISYLMDKEDKPQDQAVAIALDMEEKGKLEEGFKSGEKVTHDEYGDGVVTHPGTKNTDVAVKFEKDTGRGKSIKVSRGSLKKAVKEAAAAVTEAEDVDWKEMFPRPYPSRAAMAKFEKSGGRDADETVLAWLRSLTYDQKNFLRKLSVSEAAAATVALYQIDRRFDLHDDDPTFLSSYDTSTARTPYEAWRFLKSLGADDSFLNEEEDAMYAPMEEGLFSQSMAVRGEIDKHALNLYRVLEALRPVDRKEIIDDIIKNLQDMANEDSLPQIGDDPRDQSPL